MSIVKPVVIDGRLVGVKKTPTTLKVLRKRSFIENYLDYVVALESPENFHVWSAMSAIAAAMNRNVWRDRGGFKTYPNLWVALVSQSADTRKTTAAELGLNLYSSALGDQQYIVNGKLTPQDFFYKMGLATIERESSTTFIYADEMTSFFDKDIVKSGFLDDLTRLYGCLPYFEKSTKKSGTDVLKNICINILTTTTPDVMRDCISAAFRLGFIGRFCFCHEETVRYSVPSPEDFMDAEHKELFQEVLTEQIKAIAKKSGPFIYGFGAKERFEEWYIERSERLVYSKHMAGSGFLGRIGELVQKLSMILSASQSPYAHELLVEQHHVDTAIELAEQSYHDASTIFRGVGRSIKVIPKEMAEDALKQTGEQGMTVRALYNHMGEYINHNDMVDVVKSLIMEGRAVLGTGKQSDRIYHTTHVEAKPDGTRR